MLASINSPRRIILRTTPNRRLSSRVRYRNTILKIMQVWCRLHILHNTILLRIQRLRLRQQAVPWVIHMPTLPATIRVRHSHLPNSLRTDARLSSLNMVHHNSTSALSLHSINTAIKAHRRLNNPSHMPPPHPSHSTLTLKCLITRTNGSRLPEDRNPLFGRLPVVIPVCLQRYLACQKINMHPRRRIKPMTVNHHHPSIRRTPTAPRLRFQALLQVQHRPFMEQLQGQTLWAGIRRRDLFLAYRHSKPMRIISSTDAR
jgi:hypothetical protein